MLLGGTPICVPSVHTALGRSRKGASAGAGEASEAAASARGVSRPRGDRTQPQPGRSPAPYALGWVRSAGPPRASVPLRASSPERSPRPPGHRLAGETGRGPVWQGSPRLHGAVDLARSRAAPLDLWELQDLLVPRWPPFEEQLIISNAKPAGALCHCPRSPRPTTGLLARRRAAASHRAGSFGFASVPSRPGGASC